MAISELQLALIGAGAAAVALVWGYNLWQDRQHRKTAERIFKGAHGDALLPAAAEAAAAPGAHDGERQEPHIGDDGRMAAEPAGDGGPAVADAAAAVDAAAPVAFPAGCADAVADCVLRLNADSPLPAAAVRALQAAWAASLSKPVHCLARNAGDAAWRLLVDDDGGHYAEWAIAIQLADRRGPITGDELALVFDGVQKLVQRTGAALELPDLEEVALHATQLDEFCATVDIQFVLHVVEADGGTFAGTKLRGVAEAAGLALEGDGVFRARDAEGGELFTVANLGGERLDADALRTLVTAGLTLSLDVPRVADGGLAFDRMLAVARQLATALGGVLVDAQRAPLSEAMIDAIRTRTAELQQRMRAVDIVPGGPRALRLFS